MNGEESWVTELSRSVDTEVMDGSDGGLTGRGTSIARPSSRPCGEAAHRHIADAEKSLSASAVEAKLGDGKLDIAAAAGQRPMGAAGEGPRGQLKRRSMAKGDSATVNARSDVGLVQGVHATSGGIGAAAAGGGIQGRGGSPGASGCAAPQGQQSSRDPCLGRIRGHTAMPGADPETSKRDFAEAKLAARNSHLAQSLADHAERVSKRRAAMGPTEKKESPADRLEAIRRRLNARTSGGIQQCSRPEETMPSTPRPSKTTEVSNMHLEPQRGSIYGCYAGKSSSSTPSPNPTVAEGAAHGEKVAGKSSRAATGATAVAVADWAWHALDAGKADGARRHVSYR